MPKLLIHLEDGSQVTHELSEDNITVGRISDNILQIDAASVSSHHAEFVASGGGYVLRDLDSTNGTRVNGKSFSEGPVRSGDHIQFGNIETVYTSENPADAQPLPQQEAVAAHVASSSALPQDFANASPFKTKSRKKDPIASAILAFAGLAVIAFLGAVFMIFQVQPPQ